MPSRSRLRCRFKYPHLAPFQFQFLSRRRGLAVYFKNYLGVERHPPEPGPLVSSIIAVLSRDSETLIEALSYVQLVTFDVKIDRYL